MNRRMVSLLFLSAILARAAESRAQETSIELAPTDGAGGGIAQAPHRGAAPEPEPDGGIGLNFDVGVSSVYVFRGLNVFIDDEQMDQNMLLAPSATWTLGDTGLSIGYWGAYQLTGDNISENIDAGLGAEQDLIVGYEVALTEQLTLALGLTYYFYPFAKKEVAGVSNPSYLEPGAGIGYSGPVDMQLKVSYFAGLQDELEAYRYLYINPSVGKSLSMSEAVGLDLLAGFGYKIFNDDTIESNTVDALVTIDVPIAISASTYVKPGVGASWTNLEQLDFSDEYVVWGALHLGLNL